MLKIIETNSPEETWKLGYRLGEAAAGGQVICLNGDLGVGKTVFTQGFAAGLGIGEPVNSPTFTILQIYEEGRLPLYHVAPHQAFSFEVNRSPDLDFQSSSKP